MVLFSAESRLGRTRRVCLRPAGARVRHDQAVKEGRHMHPIQDRRCVLAGMSSIAAMGVLGARGACAQEGPLETSTIRIMKLPDVCIAPQYVAEALLKTEGFNDVQYVDVVNDDLYTAFAAGKFDITMAFVAPFIMQADAG